MASAPDPRPELRTRPLYEVPPRVHYDFCRVMDELEVRDWTDFASQVLTDITAVRLVEKKEHRTDALMQHWQNRNGSVGELLDLLQMMNLLRAWDIINNWASSLPPRVAPPPPRPSVPPPGFDPPHKAPPSDPPAAPLTCPFSQSEMAKLLPKPQPPELQSAAPSELSTMDEQPQPLCDSAATFFSLGVMAWPYEEVHAGTCGFSDALKVGEGGFGVVYRASLRNTDCAVKKFKKDCSLDWSLLRDSFQTEVEKLSKFRHPNIVDLLGFSEGGGTYVLIYSFMKNRSLDDQLRSDGTCLSWSQRVSIAVGAAKALQYLHSPPGQATLVHGDVKSSNILLDGSTEAKLADFGLARFMPHGSSGRTATQTCSFGKTQEVRGTLAYLPLDYIRRSAKLNTAVDVYAFGVVLLEILTGRRALENDKKTGREFYLKDLVKDIDDSEAEWRKQLDRRLMSGGAADPSGFMQVVSLAQSCCSDQWKKRPSMTQVFKTLEKLHTSLNSLSSSSSSFRSGLPSSRPGPPRSLDSCLSALSLNTAGPLENALDPRPSSLSPPQSLLSSTESPVHPPLASLSAPPLCSSFDGPCETDESRGWSQYGLKSNGLGPESSRCESQNRLSQPSVPTENMYNFSLNCKDISNMQASELPACSSLAESLRSKSPVVLNPSKQHMMDRIDQYKQGLIHTPDLFSSEDPYAASPAESRLPEESDELEFLPSKTQ